MAAVVDAGQVGVDHLVPGLGRDLVDRPEAAAHPGVGHQDVQAAELLHRGGDQPLDLLQAAHVGLQADHATAAGVGQFGGGLFGLGAAT